jgi:archaellum component FlaC
MSLDLSMFMDENGNIPSEKVETLKGAVEKYNEGLVKNKESLLEEKKALQKRMKIYEGIDPEKVKELQEEYDRLSTEVAAKQNDAETIKESLTKKYESQLEEYKNNYSEIQKKYQDKIVNETLTSQLEAAGVDNPVYKKAALAMIKPNTKFENETVLVGDKTAEDFIKEWTESDEAKAFITARNNTGGGIKSNANGGVMQKISVNASIKEKTAYIAEHGREAFEKAIVSENKN